VTYGEVQSRLREDLCGVMGFHRVLQGLGAANGMHAQTTTPAERAELSELVQRYRLPVVCWLDDLARVALSVATDPGARAWNRAVRMGAMLGRVREHPGVRSASLDQLVTPQTLPMVEAWRRAAVAAVEGRERELSAIGSGMSHAEALTVLGDVADLARALVLLDRRYENVPGWRPLGNGVPADGRMSGYAAGSALLRAAEACRTSIDAIAEQRAAVEGLGYRRPVDVVAGPYADGVPGALDALANSFRRLRADFPSGRALRMLVRVHHDVSRHAVRLAAGDPVLTARFERRTRTYRRLLATVRNVDGLVGRGMDAVADAQVGAELLATAANADGRQLAALAGGLAATDRRLCDILRLGAEQRLYFVASGRHLEQAGRGMTRRATTTWAPIDDETHPEFGELVRALWPESAPSPAPAVAAEDRRRLENLLRVAMYQRMHRRAGRAEQLPQGDRGAATRPFGPAM
jgi:hypothetical protein